MIELGDFSRIEMGVGGVIAAGPFPAARIG
jgi:hypothetical protein